MPALSDISKPVFLTTDVRDVADGAIGSRQANNIKKHLIIACYSRRFTPRDKRYREQKVKSTLHGKM